MRGLRADVINDVRDAKLDLPTAAERQKAEREEALQDIERILGDLFECV